MNRTSIEWTDFTWNPVTGCTRGCTYCYARRLAHGRLRHRYLANSEVAPGCDPANPFSPRFWRQRLQEPGARLTPSKIFTVDMGDLWDPHVPAHWIDAVMAVVYIHKQHTFQFLTKCPARAAVWTFPPNAWVGVTIDSVQNRYWDRLHGLSLVKAPVRFISYEPLLSPFKRIPNYVDWIVVGAMTGPNAVKPKGYWIQRLLNAADEKGIPVFLKDNLNWPTVRREWPK